MSGARWLAGVRRARVGSTNAPKIEAVRSALSAYVTGELRVSGVAVKSGVPEQPVGYAEIIAGARNRARAAYRVSCLPDDPQDSPGEACDLAVGIEDGLVELPGPEGSKLILNVGCALVTDGRHESLGFSSAFAYPADCTEPAFRKRAPIGELFDRTWQRYVGSGPLSEPSSTASGNVGKLTLGVLARSEYARHAVLCALVAFLHPDLYRTESSQAEALAASDTPAGKVPDDRRPR